MTLRAGESVHTSSGNVYVIDQFFNEGGQATLYTEQTGQYLVKVYDIPDEVKRKHLIDKFSYLKNVNLPDNFIKIIDVITEPCVGLVLEKLDEKFCQLSENLANKMNHSEPLYGLRERLVKASIIAKAFRQLHYKNLAYCDISPANIMVKETGKGAIIKIIDIDNIYVPGFAKSEVAGTPHYMAPEVMQERVAPDILSDNFSLGIIVFEMLRMGNPYVGKEAQALSPQEEDEIAAEAKLGYVKDDDPALMPAADVFTPKINALARRCFVEGRSNRMERPSCEEWEAALVEASNQVLQCPQCGEYTYAFGDKNLVQCCNNVCRVDLKRDYVLRFYDEIVVEKEKQVYHYPTGKEFVLRPYLGKGKFEINRIKNFYLCDLQIFPYDEKIAQENESKIEKTQLELFEVEDEKQERFWCYRLKNYDPSKSYKYEYEYNNERKTYPLEQTTGQLKNFNVGVVLRLEKKMEQNKENGEKYTCQRIARVEK